MRTSLVTRGCLSRKLRSQRGASVIIALLLVLVCVCVAALLTLSSSVNAERTKRATDEHQSYYALSSGVVMARRMVTQDGPIANLTMRGSDTGGWTATVGSDPTGLATWAANAVEAKRTGSASATALEKTVTVSVTIPDGSTAAGNQVQDADLTFKMENGNHANYDIEVVASLHDSAQQRAYPTKLYANFKAQKVGDALVWGPGDGTVGTSGEGVPHIGSRPTQTERAKSSVWGLGDGYAGSRWDDVVWYPTSLDGSLVAANSDGYTVLVYRNGAYYKPQVNGVDVAFKSTLVEATGSEYVTNPIDPLNSGDTTVTTARSALHRVGDADVEAGSLTVSWVVA